MIDQFRGEYYYLSNFYYSPFQLDGQVWHTVEHWFQFNKVSDKSIRDSLLLQFSSDPREAKRIGRVLDLRSDWESVKNQIMYDGLYAKFTQNQDLGIKLQSTGNQYIVEKNNWGDSYWGVCNGRGKNVLGILLMKLREELKSIYSLPV